MNVFFRVDSNKKIGAGHLARCSYLANFIELESAFPVLFISDKKDFCGHRFIEVKKQIFIDCSDLIKDAEETIKILKDKQPPKALLVDSYSLDEKWEKAVRPYVDLLVVIDDLADRNHSCDVLIDCGYQRLKSHYADRVENETTLLIGLDYCFISPDIQKIKNQSKIANKIHLYFGSTISNDLVLNYFVSLKRSLPDYCFNVVLPNEINKDQKELWVSYCENNDSIFVERPLSESLIGCSFAIGAPGIATWERAFLEIPGIYIAVNENQIQIIKDLEKMNFCKYAGEIKNELELNMYPIKELFDSGKIQNLKRDLSGKIDGKGLYRILEMMKGHNE